MSHCWLTSVPIPLVVLPTLALWTHLILKRFGGPEVFPSRRWAAVTASSCSHHACPCPAADFISSVSHHGPCVPLFIPRIIHSTHVGDWWEFPGGPVVRTSCFHCLWGPGWSLVRELRFHKCPAVAKRKTRQSETHIDWDAVACQVLTWDGGCPWGDLGAWSRWVGTLTTHPPAPAFGFLWTHCVRVCVFGWTLS